MKYMILLIIHGLIVLSSGAAFGQNGVTPDSSIPISDAPADATATKGAPETPKTGNATGIATAAKSLDGAIFALDPSASVDAKESTTFLTSDYQTKYTTCSKEEAYTNYTCAEKTSPQIATALPVIQGLIAAMGSGVKDACSSTAKALGVANAALLAYQGACAATKWNCQSDCSTAATKLKENSKKLDAAGDKAIVFGKAEIAKIILPVGYGETIRIQGLIVKIEAAQKALDKEAATDLDASNKSSVAGMDKTCSSYSSQLASAIAGTVGVLQSISQAKKCDKQTAATTAALATAVDCTLATNNLNQTCICLKAPRTSGCTGGLDNGLNTAAANSMGATALGAYSPAAANTGGAAMDASGLDGLQGKAIDPGTGLSGTGAPVGGKAAGIDGGSNGNGVGSPAAQKAGTGLSTNILSGEGGGGGGGGGYSSGSDSASGLRQYLPGGKRDPASGLAGVAVSTGVTGPGGKSNWEKVRERYRDNNTSLLGN